MDWKLFLALVFFVAGFLMVIVQSFFPERAANRVPPKDQALIYASLFIIAGFFTLLLPGWY